MKYEYVIKALEYLYSLDSSFKDNLVVVGGIVPYIATNTISGRIHGDIDLICDINHIDDIRKIIKENNLYKSELDSKLYLDNDYGFHFIINDIPIGIYPYFEDDELYQRSYDGSLKIGKTKKLNISIDEYINNDFQYKTMALEVILKSKLAAYRNKDKPDIDVICKHGINSDLYSKIKIENI